MEQQPEILHFDHAGVTVTDLDRSVAFYRDLLGLGEVERTARPNGTHLVFLKMGEAGLFELIWRAGGASGRYAAHSPSVGHICLHVNNLDAWIAKLAANNVPLTSGPSTMPLPSGSVRLIFFADPDGIPVEMYEREHDV